MAVLALPANADRFHYRLRIDLDGTFFRFRVRFCQPMESWVIDLLDDGEAPIVTGLRVCLSSDLLAPYRHLAGVPIGRLGCVDTQGKDAEPDRDNFGTRVLLVYVEGAGN